MRLERNAELMRIDKEFKREIDGIKLERVKLGKDSFMQSDRRLTKALIRTSLWNELKKTLILSPLDDDRRKR